jgi:hypothetical protein
MRQIGTTGNLRMVQMQNLPVGRSVNVQFASGGLNPPRGRGGVLAFGIEADMAGLLAASTRAQMTRTGLCPAVQEPLNVPLPTAPRDRPIAVGCPSTIPGTCPDAGCQGNPDMLGAGLNRRS